jgi:hypothetical protein
MGRTTRSVVGMVRWTPGEKSQVEAAADAAGETFAGYVRLAALERAQRDENEREGIDQ